MPRQQERVDVEGEGLGPKTISEHPKRHRLGIKDFEQGTGGKARAAASGSARVTKTSKDQWHGSAVAGSQGGRSALMMSVKKTSKRRKRSQERSRVAGCGEICPVLNREKAESRGEKDEGSLWEKANKGHALSPPVVSKQASGGIAEPEVVHS